MAERRGAVITGGSSGIGLATAKRLASLGYDVGIVARDPGKLAAARELIEAERADSGQLVLAESADLSDFGAARAAIERLLDGGIAPDVVVNSAGVIIPGVFETMPLEHLRDNIDCGFWSVVHPCKVLAPVMVSRGSGHIFNVSSVAGYLGIYGYTGYSAAKYAVMGFTEALRFEMKPAGVRVSVVCPPDTDTPALAAEKRMRPPETERIAGNIKAISPDKVAAAIVKAIDSNRHYVIPDLLSAFYFRLKGIWPEVFFMIVDSDVRKARASASRR